MLEIVQNAINEEMNTTFTFAQLYSYRRKVRECLTKDVDIGDGDREI